MATKGFLAFDIGDDKAWLGKDENGWARVVTDPGDALLLSQDDDGYISIVDGDGLSIWLTMAMADFGDKAWVGFFTWISSNPWEQIGGAQDVLKVAGHGGYAGSIVGYVDQNDVAYLGDMLQDDAAELLVCWDPERDGWRPTAPPDPFDD